MSDTSQVMAWVALAQPALLILLIIAVGGIAAILADDLRGGA
jgi:hypothetical protein